MAAKDYVFQAGWLNVYLAKKIKSKNLMSQDRRIVTDGEIIALFEHYLRKHCKENNCNFCEIRDKEGKRIFSAELLDCE